MIKNFLKNTSLIISITLIIIIGIEVYFSLHYAYIQPLLEQKVQKAKHPNHDAETAQFFEDSSNFRGYPYKGFVGWVSPEISSDSLNVNQAGRRITVNREKSNDASRKVHFFGGSTIWGYGVSDKNTIPSLFSQQTGYSSINYGEQAYNSRQNLNLMINKLDQIKSNDLVVFYDGINDTIHNCRSLNSINGHAREGYLKHLLEKQHSFWASLVSVIEWSSSYRFVKGYSKATNPHAVENKLSNQNLCRPETKEVAEEVADFIVNNWFSAEKILAAKNVPFMCVLQPVPYTLGFKTHSHSEFVRKLTDLLYPLIREKAQHLECFKDYSDVFTEDVYIDSCCHVNARGNKILTYQFVRDIDPLFKK